MRWARRDFLRAGAVLGAAMTAGCAATVGGSPRPDPSARPAPEGDAGTVTPDVPTALTVGILAYPPYTIQDGDGVTGPVPEVALAVLDQLGVSDVKFQVMSQEEQLLTAMAAGAIDLGGGLTIRPDLCGHLTYSAPDHVSGTAFAVAAGNPKGLRTYADVVATGAKLAVLTGLPEDGDAVAAGVPDGNLVRLPDPTQLLDAVRNGPADCFAFDDISLRDMVKNNGQGLEVSDPFLPDGRPPLIGAYCFPTDADAELVASFNHGLRDLHASGDWGQIVAPFGFTEFNAPPEDLTTEKACAGG